MALLLTSISASQATSLELKGGSISDPKSESYSPFPHWLLLVRHHASICQLSQSSVHRSNIFQCPASSMRLNSTTGGLTMLRVLDRVMSSAKPSTEVLR
jgi:hypothetical protein